MRGSLHDCSELVYDEGPVYTDDKLSWQLEQDKYALSYITTNFAVSSTFFGKGSFGVVVGLNYIEKNDGSTLVVKIIPFQIEDSGFYDPLIVVRDAQQELYISCQVNNLNDFTPVFIHTYGWLISEEIPKSWLKYINFQKIQYADVKKKSYMFLFMEKAFYPFDSDHVKFSNEGYLTILFVLLHALYIGRRELQFTHSDLHMRNIMLDITREEYLQLKIEEEIFSIALPDCFLPKIIDFGLSRTEKAWQGGGHKNDVSTLFGAIITRAEKYDPEIDMSQISEFEEFDMDIVTLLTKHPLFDTIRRNKKHKKIENKCSMCGGEAKMRYDTNNNFKYCHEYCANKMKGIIPVLGCI